MGKISMALRRLFSYLPADPRVRLVRERLMGSVQADRGGNARTVLAVQSVEDVLYFGLFSAIVCELRRVAGVRVDLLVVRSISGAIGVGWLARLMRSMPMGWVLSSQWVRAYRGWSDGVGYRSQSFPNPLAELVDWVRSARAWRRLRNQAGNLSLVIDGVQVGDLVNDSYLRFRPAPHFNPADTFVPRLIRQAHRDVRRARRYFAVHKPKLYLTSYSTYIEHGIPVRVALALGIRVLSFGNLVQFGKQLSTPDWFHTPNCEHYKSVFDTLDRQGERLARAEQQLGTRLAGGVDAATSYMRASAYSGQGAPLPPDMRDAVVVFLHDFYDSPHVYDELVFDDFWAWICFTIETLDQAGTRFYLKPHPNQIALSNDVLLQLRAAYPDVRFLPSGVTNVQLANAGIACGVTVYGTVAHELAYLGVPTIACAKHPHNAFEFCRTARNKAQYAALLRTPSESVTDQGCMRRQALAFYYMHNLHGEAGQFALRSAFLGWWKACQRKETTDDELVASFDRLRHLPEFASFVRQLVVRGS